MLLLPLCDERNLQQRVRLMILRSARWLQYVRLRRQTDRGDSLRDRKVQYLLLLRRPDRGDCPRYRNRSRTCRTTLPRDAR